MTRLLRALVALGIASIAALWAVPVMAAAAVTLIPNPALPGGPLTVQGTGFSPTTTVRLFWNGAYGTAAETVMVTSDDTGAFTETTTVPAAAPFTLSVCDVPFPGDCNDSLSKVIVADVTAPGPTPFPTPPPSPPVTPPPSPEATPPPPVATPTPTAAPTATAQPTPTAHPTARPAPARTPTPTATPAPTPTPQSTPDPTPSETSPPQASIATPPLAPPSSPPPAAPLSYDPAAHVPAIVNLQVTAFALLSIVGTGGLAGAGMALRPAAAGGRRSGSIASGKVKHARYTGSAGAVGDRSRTWRWPGTPLLDGLSLALPARVAPRSPLLARLLVDGAHLRAMLGSLSMLAPATGVVLGALALHDTGAHALPPQLPLLAAICALSVVDAMAGIVAAVVFGGGVVLTGGLATADDLRVLLGLGGLWFAAPLIASAARPLRRPPG
ncbi:MAG: hypothetical protein QOG45_573, partial [Chloroflexota bacterium]|nr:hypothetical protein [Chloroflexota bacterium]